MPDPISLLVGGLVVAVGTYVFRLGGPALQARTGGSERVNAFLDVAALVLLAAVMATTALTEDGRSAGIARPAGVFVAGVLAWKRAPLVVVVLAAAAVTAGLRLAGVP